MRTPTIRSTSRIAVIVLVTIVGVHSLCALAQSQPHPLAPPDLSSPRATLRNFLKLMDTAYHYWKSEGRTYENRGQRAAIGRLAHQFFDLNDIAPSVRNNVGRETAVFMKEVLDRIELPPWEEIPDEAMIAAKPGGLNRWTIPHTEITLVRLKEGLHEGNWVFNSETDERAPEFYEQVKQMPYKPGASEGLYQLFVSEPGWMIPRSLIGALPGWMQLRPGGQAVWQWCALVLTLLVTAVLMVLIFAVVLTQAGPGFLADQVVAAGRLFAALDFALALVSVGVLGPLMLGI